MKIAISSAGPDLGSDVDPRFGRCAYLIFYDTDTGDWEAVSNANRDAAGGAGIRTSQLVIDRGAEAVVTGNIGPNAMQVLSGRVKVHTGFFGPVEQAIQAFKEGSLADTTSATVKDHAGMAGGPFPGGGPAAGPGAAGSPYGGMGPFGGRGMSPYGGMGPGAGGGMGPVGTYGPAGGPAGTWRGGRGRGGCGWGCGRRAWRW